MTFDETKINRENDGRFGAKNGSAPDISLVDDTRLRRLLQQHPRTRFTPGAGAPPEFTLQAEDIPAPLINPFKQGDKLVIPARTRIAHVDSYWSDTGKVEETQRARNATAQLALDGGYATETKGRRPPFFWDAVDFKHPRVYWYGKDTVYSALVTPEILVASGQEVRYNEERRERFIRRYVEHGDHELRGFA